MTLRSIDTQLSLSRTMDAGTIQNQLNHKPTDDQTNAASQAMKHQLAERNRSAQVDKTSESRIRDGSQNGNPYRGKKQAKQKDEKPEDEHTKGEHPYKGKFIDFSM